MTQLEMTDLRLVLVMRIEEVKSFGLCEDAYTWKTP